MASVYHCMISFVLFERFLNLVTCSLIRFDWILILASPIPGFPDDWVTLGRVWSTDDYDHDNGEH